ncbi:MAG: RsmB/NOP family class I SAM-dependent RNA methyltransferase, partial [Bacteroidetes bacterium]|nr:RsmB/NOP family class I SAM-dependent RNA methyltransferase [Bacteroidota bacterium]
MELPEAFLLRLKQEYPADYKRLNEVFSEPPGVSVNLHPRKFSGIRPETAVLWNPSGFILEERPTFIYDPWFHAGAYYVQEAGSQLIGTLFSKLALPEHPRVLDLCAAPGGKSVHLANILSGKGVLVSNESIRTRVGVLQENITKAGWDNTIVTQADPAAFGIHEHLFDVVLVDAPCSGEGMFRKSEEARQHWSPELVGFCAARQGRLLADIWPAIKPGGFLIYSTCTLNQEENEAQLQQLMKEYDAEAVALDLPDTWGLQAGKSDTSCWYNWPGNGGGEGFFAGVLQKSGSMNPEGLVRTTPTGKQRFHEIREWLLPDVDLVETEAGPCIVNNLSKTTADQLKRNIRVCQVGTAAGVMHGAKFKPDPALALSVHFNTSLATPLSLEETIAFLCGDGVIPSGAKDGWNAVSFKGLPLGWINFLGRRSNNNWPQAWRIRNRP